VDALPARPADTLRILTWHVHGNYLYALTQVPHEFIIPVCSDGRPGYAPLGNKIPWGRNVRQVRAEDVVNEDIDCVIYQSKGAYEDDAPALLSAAQRALPSLYIEHDPPRPYPVDTPHWFKHDCGILVHVTHYNALNWDAGSMPTRVIEHGVPIAAGVSYSGELERGITVINGLAHRGRRMGADLFEWTRERVPMDLIGMESDALGGLGEVANMDVAATVARYRFFYTPIRYTSLGLALIEAMLAGVPIVGVAATELPTVIVNEHNGFVHTDRELLVEVMRALISDPELARRWGAAGQATARKRFGMARFIADWQSVIAEVTATRSATARIG